MTGLENTVRRVMLVPPPRSPHSAKIVTGRNLSRGIVSLTVTTVFMNFMVDWCVRQRT